MALARPFRTLELLGNSWECSPDTHSGVEIWRRVGDSAVGESVTAPNWKKRVLIIGGEAFRREVPHRTDRRWP